VAPAQIESAVNANKRLPCALGISIDAIVTKALAKYLYLNGGALPSWLIVDSAA
jgi:hypothetical protein